MIDTKLSDVIDSCWSHFTRFRDVNNSIIANPSIPILWFGDYNKYLNSPSKIVTIAINPSSDEFKLKKDIHFNFVRFKEGQQICKNNTLNDEEKIIYFNTLNKYFYDTPYDWFKRMETPLNNINATFGGKFNNENCVNTAIHLDLCPLATSDKWKDVSIYDKKQLEEEGISILNKLLAVLNPDIIVVSLSEANIKKIFSIDAKNDCINSFTNDNGGFIRTYKHKNSWIIAGRNMRGTPFGSMSNEFIKESIEIWRKENE